uniref:Uncharacterized protein n=1 Tax=Anguilla anguilla TaxID=7936 RepID=A0A0E9WLL1_ANGAN
MCPLSPNLPYSQPTEVEPSVTFRCSSPSVSRFDALCSEMPFCTPLL